MDGENEQRAARKCCFKASLVHKNAPAHTAASVYQFLTQNILSPLSTPYPPDLYPPGYFLFSKLKMKLKGLQFANIVEIQDAATDELKKTQKEEFSAALEKLYDRVKACIYANGAYFE